MAKAPSYQVQKKRSGKFFVRKRGGGVINGEEKIKILVDKGLIKNSLPKPAEPEAAAEPATGAE